MGDFEKDTRVSALGEGLFTATLSADWEIWGPNGGYLCGMMLRAAGEVAVIARPVSLYCHFLRVALFAPVELSVEVLARGRRSESLRVSMRQNDKPIAEAMVRTALPGEGYAHVHGSSPAVASPHQLPTPLELGRDYAAMHSFWRNFDVRVVMPDRFQQPTIAYPPHLLEWYRVHCAGGFDEPFLDAARTALILDTIGFPAAIQPHPAREFVAPSLDVAVWFHNSGASSDWVLAEMTSAIAEGGLMAAHGRLFTRDGALIGTSGTQLLCSPMPSA